MALVETEAIVLRYYKLSEADKIVIFLTPHSGVVRGVARGARRLKSKFGASLEPFTVVSLGYYEKESRELVAIRQADILHSHFALSGRPEELAALDYLATLVLEFSPPNEPGPALFRLLRACLSAASEEPALFQGLTRYFEVWLLKLSGFLPDFSVCSTCKGSADGRRDRVGWAGDGTVLCRDCLGRAPGADVGRTLSAEALAQLRATARLAPARWAQAYQHTPEAARKELGQLTQHLIARALERAPRTSAAHLRAGP